MIAEDYLKTRLAMTSPERHAEAATKFFKSLPFREMTQEDQQLREFLDVLASLIHAGLMQVQMRPATSSAAETADALGNKTYDRTLCEQVDVREAL